MKLTELVIIWPCSEYIVCSIMRCVCVPPRAKVYFHLSVYITII
uniref:Uncharacterized protein n=1 Tax=Arundo donax TaxID=35708 RepID=A0A0A9GS02_ARUDO